MNRPTCPRCGAKPGAAFFKPRFQCPSCGAHLSSGLRTVSVIEWALGIGPVMLTAAALKTAEWFAGWSFAQVLLLLLVPAAVVHWLVLCRYLTLQAESQET